MVFSSIPAYLDPSNWQQQPNNPAGVRTGNPRLPPLLPPPPPPPHVGGGAGSIRPGSMADRARMANIPLPEAALKCPRCESTNTKFCYFNNYSLTQPRHFCKTCRRYWTRGGALRNVPVGGGCRRNKRNKGGGSSSTSSKSPASGDGQTSSGNNSSSAVNSSNNAGTTTSILGLTPQIPPFRFMAPLSSHLGDHYGGGEMGLTYGGISVSAPNLVATSEMNFQLGSSSLGICGGEGGGSYLSAGGGVEQWRLQPLPQICSLGGLDWQPGMYQFQDGGGGGGGGGGDGAEASGYGGEGGGGQVRGKLSGSGLISQMASVKMEDNHKELNLSRQFLGIPGNHDQYWSGSYDLSGFSSPSTASQI